MPSSVTTLLPVRLDLLLTRGTDNPLDIEFRNPATGEAYDITTDTVKLTARASTYSGTVVLSKTNGPGDHTTPEDGLTRIVLTGDDLEDALNVDSTTDWLYEVRRIVPGQTDGTVFFSGIMRLHPTPAPV